MFHAQSQIHLFLKFLNYSSEKKHKQIKLVQKEAVLTPFSDI
jgi:hypothetical protein